MPLQRLGQMIVALIFPVLAAMGAVPASSEPLGPQAPQDPDPPFSCSPPPDALSSRSPEGEERNFVPGAVVVKLLEGAVLSALDPLLGDATLRCAFPDGQTFVLAAEPGQEVALSDALRQSPYVAHAAPDYIRRISVLPSDARVGEQWALAKIRAMEAWDIATGTDAIVVAVLDSGVDGGHPDLKGRMLSGYDFANDRPDATDDNGHGTHVTGIVAANANNTVGVAGVSWGARVLPLKVTNMFGETNDTILASAIRYAADRGARVINMSLGGSAWSDVLKDAVQYAWSKGALLVAAAGNCSGGTAACSQSASEAQYPAAFEHVIAVGATTVNDRQASYSRTGAHIKLAAPGGDPSALDDPSPLRWILSTYWRPGTIGAYGTLTGTSSAAPHVAGLAALVWSVNPGLSNAQVETILRTTAVDLGAPGRDPIFGYGRIDAQAAVALAQSPSGPAPLPPPVATPSPVPPVSRMVQVATGGQLQLGPVTVQVPPGVVSGEGQVDAKLELLAPPVLPSPDTVLGSTAFALTLQGSSGRKYVDLTNPITVTVGYTDADLAAAGGDTSKLIIDELDASTGRWQKLPSPRNPSIPTVNPTARTISVSVVHLTRFSVAAVVAGPVLNEPPNGAVSANLGPTLRWQNPPGTTQYHIQVLPYNNDGPAINLIIGQPEMVAQGQFSVPPPIMGIGNYVMLPFMTYTWRVRTATLATGLGEHDPGWSAWQQRSFHTAPPPTGTISPAEPLNETTVSSLTPSVTWSDSNHATYYYEVQLSKDPTFETDPRRATAAVYWNLIHAAETVPASTYKIPQSAALQPEARYYWRVRPRVQGDGIGVKWSQTWTFTTP